MASWGVRLTWFDCNTLVTSRTCKRRLTSLFSSWAGLNPRNQGLDCRKYLICIQVRSAQKRGANSAKRVTRDKTETCVSTGLVPSILACKLAPMERDALCASLFCSFSVLFSVGPVHVLSLLTVWVEPTKQPFFTKTFNNSGLILSNTVLYQ